jgi:hypothetical protein
MAAGATASQTHAFFLGVDHLARRAGHVLPVAAIQAGDAVRALADGGAHAVHGGVAAADHHHALAAGVEAAIVGDVSPKPRRLDAVRYSSAGTSPRPPPPGQVSARAA